MRFAFGAAVIIMTTAILQSCQYRAEPVPVGAFNIYSSYDQKLPGKYLLLVDAVALDKDVRPTGLECSAHTYPLALSDAFRSAAVQTMGNLVHEVELVTAPVGRDELAGRGARGMIVVRGEQLIARLRAVPGLWSATIETDVEIVSSIIVDGRNGRLLGATVSGTGRSEASAGGMCSGGATALGEAATQSMRQALTRVGEELSNSERVREGV